MLDKELNTGVPIEFAEIECFGRKEVAKVFSEGSSHLEAVLLKLWEKGYRTNSCCSGIMNKHIAEMTEEDVINPYFSVKIGGAKDLAFAIDLGEKFLNNYNDKVRFSFSNYFDSKTKKDKKKFVVHYINEDTKDKAARYFKEGDFPYLFLKKDAKECEDFWKFTKNAVKNITKHNSYEHIFNYNDVAKEIADKDLPDHTKSLLELSTTLVTSNVRPISVDGGGKISACMNVYLWPTGEGKCDGGYQDFVERPFPEHKRFFELDSDESIAMVEERVKGNFRESSGTEWQR